MTIQQKRFRIFLSSSTLTFLLFIWSLFWGKKLLLAVGLFCILFILLNFLAIDLRGVKKNKIWIPLIGIGLLIWILMPNTVRQLVLALWSSLFAIWFLIFFLRDYFSKVRKIHRFAYFTSWGYIFTLITTIIFGFVVLGMNSKFPFTCDQISTRNQKIIQTSTDPFSLIRENPEEPNFEQNIEDKSSLMTSVRWTFKVNIREGFVETQKTINTRVCEAIIWQLEIVYQNPVFQIGVIFWIYLLFYGVIRLLVWIVTLIGFSIFRAVKYLGWYPTTTKVEQVEELI